MDGRNVPPWFVSSSCECVLKQRDGTPPAESRENIHITRRILITTKTLYEGHAIGSIGFAGVSRGSSLPTHSSSPLLRTAEVILVVWDDDFTVGSIRRCRDLMDDLVG